LFVVPTQVTVVLLTGAAGAHAALAFPVKARVVTGKATVATIQENLLLLQRFKMSVPILASSGNSFADVNHGSPLPTQACASKFLRAVASKNLVACDERLDKNEKLRFRRQAMQKGDNACAVQILSSIDQST
jgi:hypothetical protein